MKKIEGQGEKKKREKPTRPSQKTREFLELVESLIDWKALGKRIDAAYSSDKRGGPRTDPIILVKMILLERWYELSDVKVSKESDERLSFRRFLGLKKDEWAPDDTTISKFRTRLMEAGLHDLIFQQIMKQIEDSGYIVREGCCVIVDATAIPSQTNKGTKNKETGELVEPEATTLGHSKRPPMHGYKCHIAMEEKSKIILGMTVTPSTASEREEFKKLIKGGDKEALADKGYPSRDISDFLDINGVGDLVMEKKSKGKEQSAESKVRNKAISSRRGVIEAKNADLKDNYGLRRSPVRGLLKTTMHAGFAVVASNIARLIRMGCGMTGKPLPSPA